MWHEMAGICKRHLENNPVRQTVASVSALMENLQPEIQRIKLDKEDLPYGRYLLHHDKDDYFNIQMDIFSKGYTGSVHSHGTWGIFWVIKGSLWVTEWEKKGRTFIQLTTSFLPSGSGQCFCPPISDWHRTATPETGPQTISIHIYGKGYDLDKGVYLDKDQKIISGKRSDFKDNQVFIPHLKISMV